MLQKNVCVPCLVPSWFHTHIITDIVYDDKQENHHENLSGFSLQKPMIALVDQCR
jgi:hypothetical protein